ncbi:MAG: hypothetical protein ACREJ4_08930, partial [Candidatus Methylomirabilaceae bacterium]
VRYDAIDLWNSLLDRRVHNGWEVFYVVIPGGPSVPTYRIVAQAYVGSQQVFLDDDNFIPCCPAMRWKVYNLTGTNQWRFQYDPDNDGLNYITIGTTGSIGFSAGLPMSRTSRKGSATVAYDHPTNLKWATQPGDTGWSAWEAQALYVDDMPGWHYQWESVTSYEVLQDIG